MFAQEGSLLKSVLTCYCGAGMEEDESNHPSNRGSGSLDGSVRGGARTAAGGNAPTSSFLNMSDRTVVHSLGDTVRLLHHTFADPWWHNALGSGWSWVLVQHT